MKKKYNRLLFISIFPILTAYSLQAQSSLNSGGGDVSDATGSVSYSIGQLFYEPFNGAEGLIDAGVQHAFEITTLAVDDILIDQSIKIYPNPTSNVLNINKGTQKGFFGYKLVDMQGKILNEGVLRDENTPINLLSFAMGVYTLQIVSQENGKSKTFKILKK